MRKSLNRAFFAIYHHAHCFEEQEQGKAISANLLHVRKVSDGFEKVSGDLGKVSDDLGKVTDGLGKVSDCLKKVSDSLKKVSDGLG